MCSFIKPSAASLSACDKISLGRHPDTSAAKALTAALVPVVVAHLDRTRPMGGKGLVSLTADLGTILAGIMRPGLMGFPVRAQRSPSGSMWERAAIGRDRFWSIAHALSAAGLLTVLEGIKVPGGIGGVWGGKATALWPTPAMVQLAAGHGVTAATHAADWRADAELRASPSRIQASALVTCREREAGAGVTWTPDMEASISHMRADLQALNAANGAADIRGAGHTVGLVRRFRHSLWFGGRFYAPVTAMSAADRLRISINGASVAEVDVKASQISALLGTMGHRQAPNDAYAVPGLPRAVVKAWCIQSLGSGYAAGRWSDEHAKTAKGFKARQVAAAMLALYPFFADLTALVPPDLMAGLPDDRKVRGKAAGQWLVQHEAAILARAMADLSSAGVIVLPVHDALIVQVDAQAQAVRALEQAFLDLAGIKPVLTIKTADTATTA